MITLKELNPHNYPTTPEIEANLERLLKAMNVIRAAWGKPMVVTSGLRSQEQQQELIAQGISKAKKSNHTVGLACDIYDPDGKLYDWCKANEETLENAGLWLEERLGPWQHFQIVPPKSGKRWFMP